MRQLLLAALLPGIMLGSTLSATVNCGSGPVNGVPSGADLLLTQCTGPGGSAMATVTATSVLADVETGPLSPVFTASANLTADYQLTIFGSTGPAFYVACVTARGDLYPPSNPGGGSISFASGQFQASAANIPAITESNCDFGRFLEPGYGLPFTFGQPFFIDGTMSAESAAGGAPSGASPLGGAEFTDIIALDSNCIPSCTNGDIIPGASFTLTLVPEPSTGLLILAPVALIARSLRKRRPGPSSASRVRIGSSLYGGRCHALNGTRGQGLPDAAPVAARR